MSVDISPVPETVHIRVIAPAFVSASGTELTFIAQSDWLEEDPLAPSFIKNKPNQSLVPSGSILSFAGLDVPSGWLLCDGSTYSISLYPELYSTIGNTYGGIAGVNFKVPDLTGKFIRMLGGNADILSATQIDAIKSHSITGTAGSAGNHTHTGTTGSAGDHGHSTGTLRIQGSFKVPSRYDNNSSRLAYSGTGAVTITNTETETRRVDNNHGSSSDQKATKVTFDTNSGGMSGSIAANGAHTHTFGTNSTGAHTHTVTGSYAGEAETRPINMAFNFIIKV